MALAACKKKAVMVGTASEVTRLQTHCDQKGLLFETASI
jgi:hypothetical protein